MYNIKLELPAAWKSRRETLDGGVAHFEAFLANDRLQTDDAEIDVCVGPMPPETTAQDEAMANYVEIVGFDDDDPEDMDPLTEWPFQNRKAYGFEALCEDDSPMRVMCVEIRSGVLVVMTLIGRTDSILEELVTLVERKLRVGRPAAEGESLQ